MPRSRYTGSKDFKKHYCRKNKRNYWVLGYFGGTINFKAFQEVAMDYCDEVGVLPDSIFIKKVEESPNTIKGYKYIWSNTPNQQPIEGADHHDEFLQFFQ